MISLALALRCTLRGRDAMEGESGALRIRAYLGRRRTRPAGTAIVLGWGISHRA